MTYFIEMGIANKIALCKSIRSTCSHGKATGMRKAVGSALHMELGCTSGCLAVLGGQAGPCLCSAPGPLCRQYHTGAFVFGPAILEMVFLCACLVTQDGPFNYFPSAKVACDQPEEP